MKLTALEKQVLLKVVEAAYMDSSIPLDSLPFWTTKARAAMLRVHKKLCKAGGV